MSDFVFAIRFRADGTAEVVSSANAVEGATTRVGKAGEETGRKIKASADQAGAAQARLAQLIDQTRTPLERLQAQIAELETLVPFANSDQEIEALIRASDRLEGALAGQGAAAQVASAAQARLSQLVDQTRTPVERLKTQLSDLEALRPFAATAEQAEALDRATSRIRDTLEAHTTATSDAAEAQERLSRLIDQTRTPAERLRATYAELEKLRPFAQTGEEVLALERALATARAGLAAETDEAKEAAAAHAQLSRLLDQTSTPVERLRGELESLEALKPFTRSAQEALVLERALARTRTALQEAEDAADPVAVAARRDAEAFRALQDRLDPAAVSTRELAASQALLDRALTGQVPGVRLTDAQHAALSKTLREQHGVIDQTTGKVKLTSWQIWNLGQQVQDAGVQLVSGQSPFMVLAQQAPQAASAVGGFGNMLRLLVTPVAGVVAGVGLLVGAASLVGTRIADISAEARTLNTELRALNPELKVTAESMRLMAFSIAEQSGASRQDASGALLTAAKNRAIRDVGLLRDIATVAQDVSAVTGEAADAVAGKIASAYAKGAAGIAQLDEELGFLTREQAEHVRLLDDQGRRTEALAVATEALKNRFGGAVTQMRSEWGNAFHEMGKAWDSFADRVANSSFGKWLAEQTANAARGWKVLLAGPTPEQQAVALNRDAFQKERELGDLEKKRGRLPDPALETRIASLKAEVADLRRQEAELIERMRAEAAARGNSSPSYAPGGGRQQLPRAGAVTEDEGKRLDAAAEANERYFKALQKVGAERQIALAGAQAYEEALRRGDGREARLEAAAQAETRARKELGAAIADQTAQYSLQVRGLLAQAAATNVSAAAGLEAAAALQAQTDSLTSNVDAHQRQQELVRQGGAQQAVAIAQATDALRLESEWTLKVADATRDGIGARDEMQRRAEVARQTSQLLAYAQAAENQGDLALAQTLRQLAASYDAASKAAAQARQLAAGADAIRTSKADLEYARAELGLMNQTQGVRDRALASLRIQRQAMELFRDTSTEALRRQRDEWIALQERIADTQAVAHFLEEVQRVSEDISRDVAENLYDRMMDPSKATSVVDFFKGIFKRIAVEALKTQVVMPIVTQVVGSIPGLFGIQSPASGAAAQGGAAGTAGGMGSTSNLLSAGNSLYNIASGTNTLGTMANGFATSALGQGLGLSIAPTASVQASQLAMLQAANPGLQITGSQLATATPQLTSAGTSFTGAASAIGYAAPYGMLGGMGGAALSNAYFGGSKVAGGVSGAILGVGSMAAGTAAMGAMGMGAAASAAGVSGMAGATAALAAIPVWGWIAAAVLAAITAIAGSQKPSVGPLGGGNFRMQGGRAVAGTYGSDNEYPDENSQKLAEVAATSYQGFLTLSGAKFDETYSGQDSRLSHYAKDNKWRSLVNGVEKEFANQGEAIVDLIKRSAEYYEKIGVQTLSDENVKKAIANSKAKDAEEFLRDVAAGRSWSDIVKGTTAGYNPFAEQITSMMEAAKKTGEQFRDQFVDLKQRILDLGLASEQVALPKLRTVFEAQLGFGELAEPLRGMAAVTKQTEIEIEALKPTMEALGYTAGQQADLISRINARAKDNYEQGLQTIIRPGRISMETSIDEHYRASSVDTLRLAGIDQAMQDKLPAFVREFAALWDGVAAGAVTANQLRSAHQRLADALRDGLISGEQYNTLLGNLTDSYRTASSARSDLQMRTRDAETDGLWSRVDAIRRQGAADSLIDRSGALTVARASLDALFGGIDPARLRQLRSEFQGMPEVLAALDRALSGTSAVVQARVEQEAASTLLQERQRARSDYLSALQAEADGLRNAARQMRDLSQSLRDLPSSLDLDRELSPESPTVRLRLAREQLQDAASRARTGDATAAQEVLRLIPEFLRTSRDFNVSTTAYSEDYAWATGLSRELAGVTSTIADGYGDQARVIDRQIVALGGSVRAVNDNTDALKSLHDATLAAADRFRTVQTQDYGDPAVADSNRIIAAAAAQAGHSFTGAFRNDAFGRYAVGEMTGSGQRWGDWDTSADKSISKMLAVVSGFAGDFTSGQFVDYIKSSAVNDVQREAARQILLRNGIVPAFARGTLSAPPGYALVGEEGPEVVELRGGERIYPHRESVSMLRSWAANDDAASGTVLRPRANVMRLDASGPRSSAGVEQRLDRMLAQGAELVQLTKGVIYEANELRRVNQRQEREIARLREQLADRDAGRRRTGTYG